MATHGKIRSSKSFKELVGHLKKATVAANLNSNSPSRQTVWQGNPSRMNDDELMAVAEILRKERFELAKKLIAKGDLDSELLLQMQAHDLKEMEKSAAASAAAGNNTVS